MGGMATDPVIEQLRARGATGEVRALAESARTAAMAAAQLGVEVGAIANSLVFAVRYADTDTDEAATARPLLVLTSGAHRVDTRAVAEILGVGRLDRADPGFVRTHTGQAIGGVAPVGHPAPIQTLVDTALARYPVVWAAAGHPNAVFPTTFEELVRITGGTPTAVASDG